MTVATPPAGSVRDGGRPLQFGVLITLQHFFFNKFPSPGCLPTPCIRNTPLRLLCFQRHHHRPGTAQKCVCKSIHSQLTPPEPLQQAPTLPRQKQAGHHHYNARLVHQDLFIHAVEAQRRLRCSHQRWQGHRQATAQHQWQQRKQRTRTLPSRLQANPRCQNKLFAGSWCRQCGQVGLDQGFATTPTSHSA